MFRSLKKRLFGTRAGTAESPSDAGAQDAGVSADDAGARKQRGTALLEAGDMPGAAACYREALALAPDDVGALVSLGYVLLQQDLVDEARAALQRSTTLDPKHDDAHFFLAVAHRRSGNAAGAVEAFRTTLRLNANLLACRLELCRLLAEAGEVNEALHIAEDGLAIEPQSAELHFYLGNLHYALKDEGEAAKSYRQAVTLKPDFAQAHFNLGAVLKAQRHFDAAASAYRAAIAFSPADAQAHNDLGVVLHELGDLDAAEASYLQAVALDAQLVDAHSNLGALLHRQNRLGAAEASYRNALALAPDRAVTHNNLGGLLQELGQHDAAIEFFAQAIRLNPEFVDPRASMLFALNYHPDKSASDIFTSYREYDEWLGRPLRSIWRTHSNGREVSRRMKVGYVSPDFRQHPVRYFLEPLLAQHDKREVELYGYAEIAREDVVTDRYRTYMDHWVATLGMNDDALAERIRADGIDVLIDLAGHTDKNRLGVFARKPAPVSMSWLGFGYTTGLSAIDYLLTDDTCAPAGSEHLFSERPFRLATPGFAYRPAEGMGDVNALPALGQGFVSFGTLTRSVRVNHRTIAAWSKLLHRVPMSRLVVNSETYRNDGVRAALVDRFAVHGIGPERLDIGFQTPPWDVLRRIDIGLDCFPHNSGTTLFESLYMGVPYVTLAGRPSVGLLGSSILRGVGHPEWIAHSEDEYVDLAVALASDLHKLSTLRAGLRAAMQASALMDEAAFARKVEAACREMFRRWVTTQR